MFHDRLSDNDMTSKGERDLADWEAFSRKWALTRRALDEVKSFRILQKVPGQAEGTSLHDHIFCVQSWL
jgi:hypothetical protein